MIFKHELMLQKKKVKKKLKHTPIIRKTILSTFQMSYTFLRSMSPGTAERIIAARIALGVKYKSPFKNLSDIRTVSAITMFDTIVSDPVL